MENTKQASAASYSSKKIAEKIAQAKNSGWKELILGGYGVQDRDLRKLLDESGVKHLEILFLAHNHLSVLPPEIGKLTALRELYLFDNQLSAVPPEIGQLTALTALRLSRNRVSALPPEISRLTSLKELYLNNNQLSTLPFEIGQLKGLNVLDLGFNQFLTLPAEMSQLTRLTLLSLHDNEHLGIPPEILGPPWAATGGEEGHTKPSAILDYYFRTRKASARRALNEVKVILVGQGKVGKTSLVKRIVYDTFNLGEEKTEGINIEKSWSVPGKNKREKVQVQVNFWDFGGQEIMHATHQFFLTKRTLYLLVLDARKGENESNIHYWLKIIRSYGGDSPILVVTNQCDAHYLELNETRLRADYPTIRGFLKTSCLTRTGIGELKAAITEQIQKMPHVFDLLPKEYFDIKKELERRAAAENYIDIREYHALCRKHDVAKREEQDIVLRFLHDLGSVLSFNDPDSPYTLREMSVLNPEWVTEGVYKILNHKPLAERGGVLEQADLTQTLDGDHHPDACHHFILDMMHKFELCFTIAKDAKWLVAELLRVNEIPVEWDTAKALNFQYHYEVLPPGVICRFIVRRYQDLTNPPIYWRSGVVLEHDDCQALVRSDCDRGRMYVSVTGPESARRSMLAVIRDEFTDIHRTIPKLPVKEMVPLPDNPEVTVEYEHLLTLEAMGVTEFVPPGAKRRYSVAELLDGIEDMWMRYMLDLHPPNFVIESERSFSDAWETTCCRLLKLHHGTTDICPRNPPDRGVDLYWDSEQIAYQCKSIEDTTGKFNLSSAEKSLNDAMENRAKLPWKKFVFCTNVTLTGNQQDELRKICFNIEFKMPDFWESLIRQHWNQVKDRFRLVPRAPGPSGRTEVR